MGITTKEVEVIPTGKMIKYYKDKGYDARYKQPLIVKVEDLSEKSSVRVAVTCDYCSEECNPRYVAYCDSVEADGTYACKHCTIYKTQKRLFEKFGCKSALQVPEIMKKLQQTNITKYGSVSPSGNEEVKAKMKQTNLERYGVENPFSSKEIRDKMKQTNLARYGVENVFSSKEIQEKIKQTNLQRYGVENVLLDKEIQERRNATLIERYGTKYPLQNKECLENLKKTNRDRYGVDFVSQSEETKEKIKKTSLEKYGVENPLQNEEIKEKIKKTNLEKYGVEYMTSLPSFHEHSREVSMEKYGVYHHLQNPEILAKQKETFYKNGTCPTSKQQIFLHNLYGGEINYPVSYYSTDICLLEEKLVIEYDGGGHDLRVTLGQLTQEEFDRKEIIRNNIIKREGYKQMRIISSKDRLPQDSILLQMLEEAKQYFSDYPQHSWIEFNIDTSSVRNAEYKDGIPYSFGSLRTIKESDLQNQNKDMQIA